MKNGEMSGQWPSGGVHQALDARAWPGGRCWGVISANSSPPPIWGGIQIAGSFFFTFFFKIFILKFFKCAEMLAQ